MITSTWFNLFWVEGPRSCTLTFWTPILSLERLDLAGLIAGLCLLPYHHALMRSLAEICLCCGGCLEAFVLLTIESFTCGKALDVLYLVVMIYLLMMGPGFGLDIISFLPVPCPLYDVSLPGFSCSGFPSLFLFLNLSFRYLPRPVFGLFLNVLSTGFPK